MVIVLVNNNNTGLEVIAENHFDVSDLNVIVLSF